ncbi:MAG TPA: glycoside hydrolase family 88 protein [Bryobacterales bacterium]|nr:glycoside hydrolase family 88 protein [Bryobacterales bacterium]
MNSTSRNALAGLCRERRPNENVWTRFAVQILIFALYPASLVAQTPAARVEQLLADLEFPGVTQTAIGVTRKGTPIPALITENDLDYATPKTRILLVGGLDGSSDSVQQTVAVLEWFHGDDDARGYSQRYALSAVPVANPDGWALDVGPGNASGGSPSRGYPPQGAAYNSPTDPEAAYLWRWIGMHAPDLVVDLRGGEQVAPGNDLVTQLAAASPSGVGAIPALRIQIAADSEQAPLEFFKGIEQTAPRAPSPARRVIQSRLDRTPLEVVRQLAQHYGHKLDDVAYIPALALVGRIRLGDLSGEPSHLADVERIVAPYVSGDKPTLPENISGSNLSGHLVFSELARVTGNRRYTALAQAAADLGFDEQGNPLPAMPFHNEMSDAFFMGTPILAATGQLTGQKKYFAMAARHMKFMEKLCLRADGIYRHSPLGEAAWGRGNGFPALGFALSLSALPADDPGRADMLAAYRRHLEALLPHQDAGGMWHQVIDHPESYREFTATAMITFAMLRGLREGWLERSRFEPAVKRAWDALKTRIAPNGDLVDVCTGTGKQQTLRDYFDRAAILGPDDRGGAMALMVSTEMAYWQNGN